LFKDKIKGRDIPLGNPREGFWNFSWGRPSYERGVRKKMESGPQKDNKFILNGGGL
jgi:hypothetical protein